MKRLIEEKLINWKVSNNRKPLIINGANQIGKTYSLIQFGKTHYSDLAYFNFESNVKLQNIFEGDFNTERIILELSAYIGKRLLKDNMLIIFDEIQACPKAITSLKYFNENDNEYHIACAGSLLGVVVSKTANSNFSFPVGKIESINMFPMNFKEFLLAMREEPLIDLIAQCYNSFTQISEINHNKALKLYKDFLIVGGMPEAVMQYIETNNMDFAKIVQNQIFSDYANDFIKYSTKSESVRHGALYNSIPSQLSSGKNRFYYSAILEGARSRDFYLSIDWLIRAGLVTQIFSLKSKEKIRLPLESFVENDHFKLFMSDIGLMTNKLAISQSMLLNDKTLDSITKGALAEQYLANELINNGHKLYYWQTESNSEVDFILQLDDTFIPIECKSADNTQSKSLKLFVDKYNPKYSIRVSSKNFGFNNNIKSVPLYAAWCIK